MENKSIIEKTATCTVTTFSHLYKVLALNQSLQKFIPGIKLFALVVDWPNMPKNYSISDTVILLTIEDLAPDENLKLIINKYPPKSDSLRWSLKSVLSYNIIINRHYDNMLILDNDLFFVNEYSFIIKQCNSATVILTPHWRSIDPYADSDNFNNNFIDGVYNGGFVGVSRAGIDAMKWWAKACAFACEVNKPLGRFVDQKYLDLLHARFEGVEVVRHQGCNVANWNRTDCKRTLTNGKVMINDKFEIVFIHFTSYLMNDIRNGVDPLLAPHLEQYERMLENCRKYIASL